MSEEKKENEEQSEEQPKKVGTGKCVLVVDDDPSTVELLRGILVKEEYKILVAENGQQGIHLAVEEGPNIIIADVLMPEKDGLKFFKELRDHDETKHIPILIMTVRKKMEDTFLALGAEGFINKPIDTSSLLDMVAKMPVRFKQEKAEESEEGEEEQKEEEKKE